MRLKRLKTRPAWVRKSCGPFVGTSGWSWAPRDGGRSRSAAWSRCRSSASFSEQLKVPGRTRIPSASQYKRQSSVGRAIDSSTVTSCSRQRNTSKCPGIDQKCFKEMVLEGLVQRMAVLLRNNLKSRKYFQERFICDWCLQTAVQDW